MFNALKLSAAITFIIVVIASLVYERHEHNMSESDSDFAYRYKKVTHTEARAIDHGYPITVAKLECYKQHGMYVKNPDTHHWIKLTIDRGVPFYFNNNIIQGAFVPHVNGYTLTDTLATCKNNGKFWMDNIAIKEPTVYTKEGLVLAVFLWVFLWVRQIQGV